MEGHVRRGLVATTADILGELLDKPAFKDSLRLFLKNIDPENSPLLVRTLLGRDIEVPLAVAGVLPSLANVVLLAACELIVQVREKFPAPLLAGFVESLLSEIDRDTLARLVVEIDGLGSDLGPVFGEAWKSVKDRAGEP